MWGGFTSPNKTTAQQQGKNPQPWTQNITWTQPSLNHKSCRIMSSVNFPTSKLPLKVADLPTPLDLPPGQAPEVDPLRPDGLWPLPRQLVARAARGPRGARLWGPVDAAGERRGGRRASGSQTRISVAWFGCNNRRLENHGLDGK